MTPGRLTPKAELASRLLDYPRRVLLVYFGLTLLMTFPLAWYWRSGLPGGSGDIWQNYWNLWWWKQCLLDALNPLHTSLLFFPTGADLAFHTHSPFNQVLAMPVNLLFGQAAAYNFCVIFALTLSGFGTYLLVRELTANSAAGFLAGLVFAYFPQTVEQTLEHLNLFSLQFIPLALYFLLRWSRSMRSVDALAFGACFGLNALCSWHLGLKLAMVVAPWLAWLAWRHRSSWPVFIKGIGAAATLATLMVLPLLAPMLALISEGSDYYLKGLVNRGIDPIYLLTPPFANPLFGAWVQPRYLERAYQAAGFVCYLGFVPVALATIATIRSSRRSWPWLALFAAGLTLAMGAHLLWNGTLHGSITLPFALLREIPLLANLRVANRFLILSSIALAVLVGYGWAAIRRKPVWAMPVAATLILVEYSWMPFPVQRIELSPLLAHVAQRPGAVLDIPFHQRNRGVHNMVEQTVHGKPISGGYISSYPPSIQDAIDGEAALQQLAGTPAPDATVEIEELRAIGFRTLVIHKYRMDSARDKALAAVAQGSLLERKRAARLGGVPDETMRAIREQLDEALGGTALEDEQLAIYFL